METWGGPKALVNRLIKKYSPPSFPPLSPSNLMETLDKSPSYFDGDKALGVPPQKRIRRPRSHAQPPPPAGRNERWRWHCVADRSREQAQTPSCPTRRLLRGDGYSRRLSPTFPSEQVVNYCSANNGHDAVREGDERRPASRALYIKAAGSEAGGEVSSVIYP